MIKVIVPSALVVPKEQQNIGRLPAIIYPTEHKIMLDFILDQYRGIADLFEISLFEEAGKAKEVIESYTDKIEVCELNELRDIGYSIYYAMINADISEHDSVIINYSDVVAFDDVPDKIENTILYSDEPPSSDWAYFSFDEGKIENLVYNPEDVNLVKSSKIIIGVFYIKDAFAFLKILEEEIQNNGELDAFFRALLKFNDTNTFRFQKSQKWFDIGHSEKYFEAQVEVKARVFNHVSIDKDRGTLSKKSDDPDKFINEINWYLKLPCDVQYSIPRIFSYSKEYSSPSVTMEYYPYHTLHELMIYGNLDKTKWERIFKKIRFVMSDYGRYTVKGDNIRAALQSMYLDKTVSRIKQLGSNRCFDCLWHGYSIVNGKKYIGLNALIERLPAIVEKNLMDIDYFTIIHGDLCFSNIMIDPKLNFIKLIDPRGEFGLFDIYGDMRYELAKLLHSCDGKYDYLIKDMFSIEMKGNEFKFEIKERKRDFDIVDCFIDAFSDVFNNPSEYCKVKLIEALLFLSMISLHTESERRQLAMYCRGMQLLDESGLCVEEGGVK